MTTSEMTFIEGIVTRAFNGAPLIVVIMGVGGWLVWHTWRGERRELLDELRAEREARDKMLKANNDVVERMHREMVGVAERGVQAQQAVREAIIELRNSINHASHRA